MNENVSNYSAKFLVSRYDVQNIPIEYIKYRIEQMEMEAIYKTVKQVSGWVCIRPEIVERDDFMMNTHEYEVRVHARPVDSVNVKVYVFDDYNAAMMKNPSIPRDLHNCKWCGGYTKNDMRGHCSGCGGPRSHYGWDK